jgi:hypothetical protein
MFYDSGICTLMNLEEYEVGVNLKEKYGVDDIQHLRIKFVNEMVFGDQNSAREGQCQIKEVVLVS